MSETFNIKASDGSGSFSAYAAFPAAGGKAPAIVVIQEIFGVNAVMRGICDALAEQGFLAVCPDIFWRQEPGIQLTDKTEAEWQRAFQLFQGFDVDRGVEDLKATLAFVRQHGRCTGKAGALGYCLGGKLAYLMAARSSSDCCVSYYGVGIEALLGESPNIKNPLLMHIAEKDKFVPPAAQQKILQALRENPRIEMFVYEGQDHAFARIGGEHYDKAAAELANARSAGFLAKHLIKSV